MKEHGTKILSKSVLADIDVVRIMRMSLQAPDIAAHALPGQFVVVMVSTEGERIPLTVVAADSQQGTIDIIFQEAGLTTKLLGRLDEGARLFALAGPLGHATPIQKYGRALIVSGGVGSAEVLPVAAALKEKGNHVTVVLGARTAGLLILQEQLQGASDGFYAVTDDGSNGRKGFTTDVLRDLVEKQSYDFVYSVGPIPMMRAVARVTKEAGIKTVVSLNTLMIDATGMCGVCRVTVGGQVKFTCVDGPDFDAHLIDWDEVIQRNRVYQDKEQHICRLHKL